MGAPDHSRNVARQAGKRGPPVRSVAAWYTRARFEKSFYGES
jgi:hypothetical protein